MSAKPWTEDEDRKLVAWGCLFIDGYGYVAEHDLGRTKQEGADRINWLRAHKREWVRAVEDDVLSDDDPARFMTGG